MKSLKIVDENRQDVAIINTRTRPFTATVFHESGEETECKARTLEELFRKIGKSLDDNAS